MVILYLGQGSGLWKINLLKNGAQSFTYSVNKITRRVVHYYNETRFSRSLYWGSFGE